MTDGQMEGLMIPLTLLPNYLFTCTIHGDRLKNFKAKTFAKMYYRTPNFREMLLYSAQIPARSNF